MDEATITLSAGQLGGVQLPADSYQDWAVGEEKIITANELTEDPDDVGPEHTLVYRRDADGVAVYTGTVEAYNARIAAAQEQQ